MADYYKDHYPESWEIVRKEAENEQKGVSGDGSSK
jgi:hypothetical protein